MADEYIKRSQAIKELRNAYEYEYPTASGAFDEFATTIMPNVLRNLPAADVVEVVRCRDCEKCVKKDNFMYCEEHSDGWGDHTVYVDPDDYCSYGERRSE